MTYGASYKAINAPFGSFASSILTASTTALQSDDATYASIEGSIGTLTSRRDTLVALIKAALVHKQIGEDEQALNWLQKAVSAGYSPALVRDNPAFASLAVNQSFRALISGNHSAGNGKNRGGSK